MTASIFIINLNDKYDCNAKMMKSINKCQHNIAYNSNNDYDYNITFRGLNGL